MQSISHAYNYRILSKAITQTWSLFLRLTEKSGSNIAHNTFFQLIVLTSTSFSANEPEGGNNTLNIEAHAAETVDQVLVVSIIPVYDNEQIAT